MPDYDAIVVGAGHNGLVCAAYLAAGGLTTLLVEARHYPHILRLLDRLPAGPITLNHLGLPFPEVDRAAWRALMRALAERPASFVQLSGLPFLYGEAWRTDAASVLLDEACPVESMGE